MRVYSNVAAGGDGPASRPRQPSSHDPSLVLTSSTLLLSLSQKRLGGFETYDVRQSVTRHQWGVLEGTGQLPQHTVRTRPLQSMRVSPQKQEEVEASLSVQRIVTQKAQEDAKKEVELQRMVEERRAEERVSAPSEISWSSMQVCAAVFCYKNAAMWAVIVGCGASSTSRRARVSAWQERRRMTIF